MMQCAVRRVKQSRETFQRPHKIRQRTAAQVEDEHVALADCCVLLVQAAHTPTCDVKAGMLSQGSNVVMHTVALQVCTRPVQQSNGLQDARILLFPTTPPRESRRTSSVALTRKRWRPRWAR